MGRWTPPCRLSAIPFRPKKRKKRSGPSSSCSKSIISTISERWFQAEQHLNRRPGVNLYASPNAPAIPQPNDDPIHPLQNPLIKSISTGGPTGGCLEFPHSSLLRSAPGG